MIIYNSEIADIFNEIADLLEIQGESQFRVRAYREAARTVLRSPKQFQQRVAAGEDLTKLPGIGSSLAAKIEEIVKTGELKQLKKLHQQVPEGLLELLNIDDLGPKRVRLLYEKLGIKSIKDLKKAAEKGRIQKLYGFGEKITQSILADLRAKKGKQKRTYLKVAEEVVTPLVAYLRQNKEIEKVVVAGSYRRKRETVHDVDILAISSQGRKICEYFADYEEVKEIVAVGDTRSTVILRTGLQADLRVVPRKSYGAALLYFTGSKAHNIELRHLAIDKGFKVNEYGVFKGTKYIVGETEEEIYKLFNLDYIPPELREARGEIQAARLGKLPKLIKLSHLRGDLQMHTKDSDGENTIEEMAEAAKQLGREYIAISDHSSYMGITQGLSEKEALNQMKKIDKLNQKLQGITILKSMEVDILEDGRLSMSDKILKQLDLVICSIHTKQRLPGEKQTERLLTAMNNPYFTILAHPSGRLINQRPPMELDMEKVMKKAKQKGIILEINAQPSRLDLDEIHAKMAKDLGVKLVISTDAHSTEELNYLKYGVYQARRGWIEKRDVINTRSLQELKKLLKQR